MGANTQKCNACGKRCGRTVNMCPTCHPVKRSMADVARHSRYDYMTYLDRDGQRHEGRVSVDLMRSAMLALGTRCCFTIYAARTGTAHLVTWPLAVTMLANLKRGWY